MEWCSSSGDFNARIGKIFELTSLIQLFILLIFKLILN